MQKCFIYFKTGQVNRKINLYKFYVDFIDLFICLFFTHFINLFI